MTNATNFTPARKGDLVAHQRQNVYYDQIKRQNVLSVSITLHEVTKTSREGVVKETRDLCWDAERGSALRADDQVLVIPSTVDRDALVRAYRQHTYEGHPNQVKPFDFMPEFREFVRQFVKADA